MLAENGAAFYQLTQTGQVGYYLLPPDGAMKPALLRLQAYLRDVPLGLEIAKALIAEKVKGQRATLGWMSEQATLPGMENLSHLHSLDLLAIEDAETFDLLRLAEARAADTYSSKWAGFPVTFARTGPDCVEVPSHWRHWSSRPSLRTGTNRDATDPLNALLNFSYAVAAAETTIACRALSLDPALGILHADSDGRASFVYDLIEPVRPHVDRYVLGLVASRKFRLRQHFVLLGEGVCRLGIEAHNTTAAHLRRGGPSGAGSDIVWPVLGAAAASRTTTAAA